MRQLIRSVDLGEEVFGSVGEVVHQDLDLLGVLPVGALGEDLRSDVGVLGSQTLFEKVLLTIVSLMMDHLVRDLDVLVTQIFAWLHVLLLFFFLTTLEQTQLIVLLHYSLSALLNMQELFPIEGFLASHFFNNY